MVKRQWRMISILAMLFILLVIFEMLKPKAIDWTYDFRSESKKPNGCYVYFHALQKLLPTNTLKFNQFNLIDCLAGDSLQQNSTLVIITPHLDLDSVEMKHLLAYASTGKSVFISAFSVGSILEDTLGIITSFYPGFGPGVKSAFKIKCPGYDTSKIYRFQGIQHAYFNKIDTANSCFLGTDTTGSTNFISIKKGRGKIFVHLAPEVFSNYQMLYRNKDFAMDIAGMINSDVVIWDDFNKPGKLHTGEAQTPLRFILEKPALRMAYIVFVIALFMLFFFGIKRKQRIIPIIKRPANASLEFVRIISALYIGSRDNLKMAEKKFTFFCDYIRSHYFISAISENEVFFHWLSEKSNVKEENIKAIFQEIASFRKQQKIQDQQLVHFIKRIDDFYEAVEGRIQTNK